MGYLFTSESVSEGHPDKVADQISDAVLDRILAFDPEAKVACETLVTTGQTVIAGEIKTKTYVDVQQVAREVINEIGYTKSEYMFDGNSCGVFSAIHEQSPDINRGVVREDPMEQGAGEAAEQAWETERNKTAGQSPSFTERIGSNPERGSVDAISASRFEITGDHRIR